MVQPLLDSTAKANHGGGAATAADSAALRAALPNMLLKQFGMSAGADRGPTQCHDITVYPAIGYAGGACEGYGMLLDIHDPAHPVRLGRGVRLELLLLALGDVQQRRHQGAVPRRMGRRRRAEVPRDRSARVGRRRDLHDREQQAGVPGLLQAARAADLAGKLRGAQRLARPDPGPRHHGAGVVSGRRVGVRLDRSGARRRKSRSSIAVRWTRRGWSKAARGRRTGTTA